jgi:UDP-N-acetylglucosamine 2-epimerase (non-hydrolysing)
MTKLLNKKHKILVAFGTRPEAIKMVPVILELKKNKNYFDVVICVSGQHRKMLDSVLESFNIVPDVDLNVMRYNQDLTDITSNILLGMRDVFKMFNPDLVLVHGDTTTSFATALSAFYHNIPIGHVEAGLRSFDLKSPWPEEANRVLTGRITQLHFCPTEKNMMNLKCEGVNENNVYVTGNTVIDALKIVQNRILSDKIFSNNCDMQLSANGISPDLIHSWQSGSRKLVLITVHRRENMGTGFKSIFESIKKLAFKYQNLDFVYPVHLNPNVRRSLAEVFNYDFESKVFLDSEHPNNVHFIEPLDYFPFVKMMMHSYVIMTDSGGIQEEAPLFGIPVFVLRNTTERLEAVESGTVKLLGTDSVTIISEVSKILDDYGKYQDMSAKKNPYGDGNAASHIVKVIQQHLV